MDTSCFQVLAIVKSAALDMEVHVSFWIIVFYINVFYEIAAQFPFFFFLNYNLSHLLSLWNNSPIKEGCGGIYKWNKDSTPPRGRNA